MSWLYRRRPYEILRLDESHVDRRRRTNEMNFQFFILDDGRLIDRFSEHLSARLFTMPQMRALLARARFRLLAAYAVTPDKPGFGRVTRGTFRIMAVVRPIP